MHKFFESQKGFYEVAQWHPLCWICVQQPDEADIDMLLNKFHIPQDMVSYLSDNDERPRVERDGSWTLTIIRIPLKTRSEVSAYITVPLGVITNKDVIVTVCYHQNEMINDFIQHTRNRGIHVTTTADFTLRLIFSSTVWFLNYIKNISGRVSEGERELRKSVRNEDLLSLMNLQKSLVYFNTSLEANEAIIGRLHTLYPQDIDADLLEDVEIEIHQALTTVKITGDTLGQTLDAYASIISNNVNAIMKRMTAISIALMVPTLIASFYGMNVNIGLSGISWAFWGIIGASVALTAVVVFLLRRAGWL